MKPLENIDSGSEEEQMTTAFDEKQDDGNDHGPEKKDANVGRPNETDNAKKEATENDAIPLTDIKQTDLEQQHSPEQEKKKLIQNENESEEHEEEEEEPVNLYMISKLFLFPGLRQIFDLTTIAVL